MSLDVKAKARAIAVVEELVVALQAVEAAQRSGSYIDAFDAVRLVLVKVFPNEVQRE